MIKRWLEYISVIGILLCIGLFMYNMTEMKKLSMQYDQLQENVKQIMDNKEANIQVSIQNKSGTSDEDFSSDSYYDKSTEIPLGSYWEWEWEGPTISAEEAAQYDLVKYSYLME